MTKFTKKGFLIEKCRLIYLGESQVKAPDYSYKIKKSSFWLKKWSRVILKISHSSAAEFNFRWLSTQVSGVKFPKLFFN